MKEDTPHARLRSARENANYKSASEAARRMNKNVVTYSAHENGGREFDREAAIAYGQHFGVDPAWLMFGDRDATGKTGSNVRSVRANNNETVSAVPSTVEEYQSPAPPLGADEEWEMPEQFLNRQLAIREDRARVLEVRGDSMYDPLNPTAPGSMYPGERVIVDLDDIRPTPPGPFVIHDGAGLVVKMVETIPHSTPQMVRLSTRNPHYATYECSADEAGIVGRVKAKVSMLV